MTKNINAEKIQGNLIVSNVSATTVSATTIVSGTTDLSNIFTVPEVYVGTETPVGNEKLWIDTDAEGFSVYTQTQVDVLISGITTSHDFTQSGNGTIASPLSNVDVIMSGRTVLTGTTLSTNADIINENIVTLTESSATGGTLNLACNDILSLTTILTSGNTFTFTPLKPTTGFTPIKINQINFTTGLSKPSIAITMVSGVTANWMNTEITDWNISKDYVMQFVWMSNTRCDIYHTNN